MDWASQGDREDKAKGTEGVSTPVHKSCKQVLPPSFLYLLGQTINLNVSGSIYVFFIKCENKKWFRKGLRLLVF